MSSGTRKYIIYRENNLYALSKPSGSMRLSGPLVQDLSPKGLATKLVVEETVERPFEVTTIWATIASSEGMEFRPVSDQEIRLFRDYLGELVDSSK